MQQNKPQFRSFAEFYPYYLDEHKNSTCRRFHFIGTTLVLLIFAYGVVSGAYAIFLLLPVAGYGFAWTGHFFFEKTGQRLLPIPFIACPAILSCTVIY